MMEFMNDVKRKTVGIAIDQVDKVIHCNASKFEIPGRIECSSLSVNGREI